jgi:hypothetical protein
MMMPRTMTREDEHRREGSSAAGKQGDMFRRTSIEGRIARKQRKCKRGQK